MAAILWVRGYFLDGLLAAHAETALNFSTSVQVHATEAISPNTSQHIQPTEPYLHCARIYPWPIVVHRGCLARAGF